MPSPTERPTTIPHDSPWGRPISHQILAPGMVMVQTERHGGLHLDDWRQQQVPPALRQDNAWYEEDCWWSIPVALFRSEIEPAIVDDALLLLGGWRKELYDQIPGLPAAA